ncbi:aldehyde dehydrogenase family protein, partial [Microbacterium sp.]|uniref:aldehyde dehydrogenase family protein n=1 Tax=Microbacterium sp. TaxID=51671 RepID=UPI0039E38ADC
RWGARPAAARAEILLRAAATLESRRGDIIATAAVETGILFADADEEVGRAVDLARYYAATAPHLEAVDGASFRPVALTAIAAGAQEPFAGPADDVLAALAAGSAVALHPDPRALRTARLLAEVLWHAGVPRDVLVVDRTADHALLAGADRGPGPAEGPGCNAFVVTASADVDQAVADIVDSAFARSGQARAAISLVILVGAAGRSKRFAGQLADAVRALRVGVPGDPRTRIGPLMAPPSAAQVEAMTALDVDEKWLVRPRRAPGDPDGRLWSPGVRVGVRADAPERATGVPVLDVMAVDTLEKAIEVQNARGTGGVAGLHSRDAGELERWLDGVEAETLWVNRATTGAVVQRQPVGGRGSSWGAGAKSGGPNRLIAMGRWQARPSAALSSTLHLRGLDTRIAALIEAAQPSLDYAAFEWLRRAALSDALAWDREFGQVRDVSGLGVERNLLRYRPVPVEVRVIAGATLRDLLRVVIAAVRAGAELLLSVAEGLPAAVRRTLAELRVDVRLESDAEWLERWAAHRHAQHAVSADSPTDDPPLTGSPSPSRGTRVRLVGAASAAAERGALLIRAVDGALDLDIRSAEVTPAARIELLTFVREQSISITAHRRGVLDQWSLPVI